MTVPSVGSRERRRANGGEPVVAAPVRQAGAGGGRVGVGGFVGPSLVSFLHRRVVGLLLVDRGTPLVHYAPQEKARTTARTNSAPSVAPPADSRFFAASMVDRWPTTISSRPEYSVIILSTLWPFSRHAASGA